MNKILIMFLVILSLTFTANALVFDGVDVQSSFSNTTLTFDRSMTMDSLDINNNSLVMINVSFTGVSSFYLNTTDTANEFTSLTFDTANSTTYTENLLTKFRFYDVLTDSYVENYNFGTFTSSNTYLYVYTEGLNGSYSLDFVKSGFRLSSHSFTITQNSDNDFTFNVKGLPETVALGNILYIVVGVIVVILSFTVVIYVLNATDSLDSLIKQDWFKILLIIILLGVMMGAAVVFKAFSDTVTTLF